MHVIFWIIVGIVAGALAKRVIPGAGPAGLGGDLVIGGVGALVGGWLSQFLLGQSFGGWIGSTLVAFVGAVVLLLVLRVAMKRRLA